MSLMPLRLRLLFSDDAGSGGPTEGDPTEPDDGNESPPTGGGTTEGEGPVPAGDGTTEGDAPPAGAATDIALRVRGGELVIGGQFDLTDAAITPEKLDAGTEAKRRAMRDRIGAEGRLKPGAGITIGAEDDAGRRLIAAPTILLHTVLNT